MRKMRTPIFLILFAGFLWYCLMAYEKIDTSYSAELQLEIDSKEAIVGKLREYNAELGHASDQRRIELLQMFPDYSEAIDVLYFVETEELVEEESTEVIEEEMDVAEEGAEYNG